MKKDYINIDLKLVGSLCNLNCKYCYEHDSYENINEGFINVNNIIVYLTNLTKEYHKISVTLHGGEPLLYPKEAMRTLLKTFKNNESINLGIQTNGLLIDQEWIDIFKDYSSNFLFSISIDSVESMQREMDNGKLFDIIRKIKANNLDIGVLSLICKDNLDTDRYKKFLNFLVDDLSINFLTINKIRLNKNNLVESNKSHITEFEYTNFLLSILEYWIESKLYKKLKINPFLDIFQNKKGCNYNNDLQKCSNFTTIYPPFRFKSCDHLLGKSEDLNICLSCDIFQFCGGGCHYNPRDKTFCQARHLLYDSIREFNV